MKHGHPGVLGHQLHLDGGDQGADLQEGGTGIAPHRLDAGALQLVLAAADGNAHDAAGLQQPGDVLRQPHEGRPLGGGVDAHEVEGEGAPLQALRQHMQGGVRPRDEPSVAPNQAVLSFHQRKTNPCRRFAGEQVKEARRAHGTWPAGAVAALSRSSPGVGPVDSIWVRPRLWHYEHSASCAVGQTPIFPNPLFDLWKAVKVRPQPSIGKHRIDE